MNQNLLTKSLLFAKKTALGPSDKWKDWLPHFKAQQAGCLTPEKPESLSRLYFLRKF